jgi:hypothetical protein
MIVSAINGLIIYNNIIELVSYIFSGDAVAAALGGFYLRFKKNGILSLFEQVN